MLLNFCLLLKVQNIKLIIKLSCNGIKVKENKNKTLMEDDINLLILNHQNAT